MKKEDKELLLKDLCGRLPYGVKVHAKYIDTDTNTEVEKVGVLSMLDNDKVIAFTCDDTNYYNYVAIHEVKPYLFPLSNITEEQKKDLLLTVVGKEGLKLFSVTKDGIVSNDKSEQSLYNFSFNNVEFSNETTEAYIDWLNKNHFDYRGLIEKSLALDASGLNIY